MSGRLDGKVAVLVGAAQGIGEGIAEVFHEEGAKLVIGDLDEAAGQAVAARLSRSGEAIFLRTDISRKEDAEALVEQTLARFGRLDILVQNAGIYPWTMIEDISVEEWDRVLAVNLRGTFLAAQACVRVMKPQGAGRLVFTSSITGPRVSSPGHGHYSASKAGINGFIRAAAVEFARHGITVNGVEPGNIATGSVTSQRSETFVRAMEASVPLGRLGTPRDVAYACLYLASDEAAYVTGTTIIVDGGQILPEGAVLDIEPGLE
jgi:3-oxoacyl-[acyl-carrier protein] reductase